MNKFKYLIIFLFLFIGIKNISALNNFDNSIKVYDYAQILSDKQEENLKDKVNYYINSNNVDMVIITVKYYQQSNVNDYISLFYNRYLFGKGTSNDGIVAVIDLKDDNDSVEIKTFGNAVNLYTKKEIKKIQRESNEEKNYYDRLIKFIEYSNIYVKTDYTEFKSDDNNYLKDCLVIGLISFIITSIIIVILLMKEKKVKDNIENNYIKENSLVINKKEDKFITTHTKKIRMYKKR